jgi:gliding motility-associated-like protein
MKKLFNIILLLFVIVSCSSDSKEFDADLKSINFSCCDENPFTSENVNNLDQSRGEIVFFDFATPNGDGINDFWIVSNLELYENFSIKIFDIDENLVFQADNSSTESVVFFPQNGEFEDRDRVFQYEVIVEDETVFLNRGYFCFFTGTEKKSAGRCNTFNDPILE